MDKHKILICDDEKDLVFALKAQLETSNYEVLVAYDGQEALNQARKQSPNLIILDLMLPKLNGYKVCRMLKFDEKYKKIPIILFTARAEKEDEKLGYEVGADAYIMKLYEPQKLLQKIEELIKVANTG